MISVRGGRGGLRRRRGRPLFVVGLASLFVCLWPFFETELDENKEKKIEKETRGMRSGVLWF